MIKNSCKNVNNYSWTKTIRVYYHENGRVISKVGAYSFESSLDYFGLAHNLVFTELTSRIYDSIGHAFSLGMGGCIRGPAGTGKTETVKAMSKIVGIPALVFNCDESFSYEVIIFYPTYPYSKKFFI